MNDGDIFFQLQAGARFGQKRAMPVGRRVVVKEEGGAPLPGALDFFGTKRKEKEPPVKRRKRVVSSEAQLSDESEDSEDQNEGDRKSVV